MRIKSRLYLSITATLAVGLVILAYTCTAMLRMHEDLSKVNRYHELSSRVFELGLLTERYLADPKVRVEQQWRSVYKTTGDVLSEIKPEQQQEAPLLDSISKRIGELRFLFERLVAIKPTSDLGPPGEGLRERLVAHFSVHIQMMHDDVSSLIKVKQSQMESAQRALMLTTAAVITLLVIAICLFLYITNRAIVRSFIKVHGSAGILAEGDLSHSIEIERDDEIGELARSINKMSRVLKDRTEELRKSRDELELRVEERTAELRKYMTRLEQSNQALQDFASIASHDLQEPLRKISSFGDMLEAKCGPMLGENGTLYLDRILDATERMQTLLTALLQYSRVTTRAEPLREVDAGEIVREVLCDLEARILQTNGEVLVEELPFVQADPIQLRQLFQNLIGNGLKFHKDGVKPVVRVRSLPADKAGRRIAVEDNGIGFDEKHLEKIFAPFQRLHGRSSQYPGTGMGLAICKKIADRHGWSITARSSPGEGATFILTLPAAEEPPEEN